jgi:hypothetical protein
VQLTRAAYKRSFWGNLQQHVADATRWWASPAGGKVHRQGFRSSRDTKGFVLDKERDAAVYGPPEDWVLQGL